MFKERWLLGHRMAKRSYSTFKVRGGGREEIPHVLKPEAKGGGGGNYPTPEARVSGREEQPQAVAARAQDSLEELSHVEGQEGRR